MTRYLLDTNIISQAVKPEPSAELLRWMQDQADEDLFISAFTLAEIQRGILDKPRGAKRSALDAWFSGPEGPLALFAGRILPLDDVAALWWAELMAAGRAAGRPRSPLDMIIAATAVANDCIIVTDNVRDFHGLPMVNPMREARA